jgi:metal-responsive CopG/Arc/MetJ family transcriptional regulator
MKRVTITMPEETCRAVEHAARREGKSFSATAAELIEKQLAEQRKASPFAALIGQISDPNLPDAIDMEEALKEIWADAANRDR